MRYFSIVEALDLCDNKRSKLSGIHGAEAFFWLMKGLVMKVDTRLTTIDHEMDGFDKSRRDACVLAALGLCGLFTAGASQARTNPHGPQGTGNFKGKRDRHQKPGPGDEKKKKKSGWLHMRP